MKYKGYYKILGVSKYADTKEIKSAYKKFVKKYPLCFFRTPEQKRELREIKEAYKILSDSYKRNRYDLGLEIFTASQELEEKEEFLNTKEFLDFCQTWENCMDIKYSHRPKTSIIKKCIIIAACVLLICSIIAICYIITNLSGSP